MVGAAAQRGIRLSVCGEMAARPAAVAILIGMGITELSMNPASIPAIKQLIRSLVLQEARGLAEEVLRLDSARAIEERARRFVDRLAPAGTSPLVEIRP